MMRRLLQLAALLFMVAMPVHANVAFVSTTGPGATLCSASSCSASFTVPSASNEVSVAFIVYDNVASQSLSSVTFAGNAMQSAGAAAYNSSGYIYAEIYTQTGTASGSQTLAVTGTSGITEIYMGMDFFSGANQTTPIRPGTYQNTTNSSASSISQTITSATTDYTVSVVIPSAGQSITSNQTKDIGSNTGRDAISGAHCTTPASSITDTESDGSGGWAMVGFSIQPPSAAPACTPSLALLGVGRCG